MGSIIMEVFCAENVADIIFRLLVETCYILAHWNCADFRNEVAKRLYRSGAAFKTPI